MELTFLPQDVCKEIIVQLPTLSSTVNFISTCKSIRKIIFNDINNQNDHITQFLTFFSPKIERNITFINVFNSDLYTKLEEHFSITNKNLSTQINTLHTNLNILLTNQYPLHDAIWKDNIEAMKLLLAHSNIDVNKQDKYGYTPLYYAIWKDKIEAMKLLLAHPNIDVNKQNKYGFTPLHDAIWQDKIEAMKLLLIHSNINLTLQTQSGNTPLYYAIKHNENREIIKLLLQHSKIHILDPITLLIKILDSLFPQINISFTTIILCGSFIYISALSLGSILGIIFIILMCN